MKTQLRHSDRWYAACAVGVTLVVYAPLLKNYFWLDDFLVFEMLANWPLDKFLTYNWAGHLVVARNVFYAVLHAVAGINPLPYYLILLTLHCINVGLVFAIVHAATLSAPLACLAAAVWGTCPSNEGALGWIAASGQVIVATTTLLVVYDALRRAVQQTRVTVRRAALWALLLLIGAQSFGTGIGIAIAGPVVLLWFAAGRLTWGASVVLLCVPVATLAMYGRDYSQFSGTLGSSLFAKANVLLHLLAVGLANLLRGLAYEPSPDDFLAPLRFGHHQPSDFPIVTAYVLTAVATCTWLAAAWSATGLTKRVLITIAVLELCNYGVIAVGRAFWVERLDQSVVSWSTTARYHYSATSLLAIGLAISVGTFLDRRRTTIMPFVLIAWLAVSTVLYARSDWTIRHYDVERTRAAEILARIDAVIRDAPTDKPILTYNEPFLLDGPNIGGAASLYVMSRSKADPDVYFVDRKAAHISRGYPGSPLARLTVLPPSVGLACAAHLPLQSIAP